MNNKNKKPAEKFIHHKHIQRGVEAARHGEFATDAEVNAFFDRYGEPSPSIVDALIEGERSGTSRKKIKDIMASTKKRLKNG